MIPVLLTLVVGSAYFPSGLVSDGHPDELVKRVANTTTLGLDAAGELPCQTLAQSGDGLRFVVRPWGDGPIVVRVELKSDQWIRVTTMRLGVRVDESGFILESQETRSLMPIEADVVRRQLQKWSAHSTPYQSHEDGSEVIVEQWKSGACLQVLDPDFNFVATSLMLLGVDPDEAFASGRRRRPPN